MKPLIYLACPYSHSDLAVMQWRFECVNKVAGKLMEAGEIIFSPLSHTHPIAVVSNLPRGWDYWKKFDYAYLDHSNAVYVLQLEGWDTSIGVAAEVQYAIKLRLGIKYLNPEDFGLPKDFTL